MDSSPSVSFGNNRIIPKPWKKGKGPSTLFPCYRFPRDITIQQKMSGKRNSGKNSRPVWKAGREFLIPKPFQRLSGRRTQNQKALFLKEKQRFRRMMFVFQKNGVSLSKRMASAFLSNQLVQGNGCTHQNAGDQHQPEADFQRAIGSDIVSIQRSHLRENRSGQNNRTDQ